MLIFDFDGVLLDSVDEALITAYNAVTGGLKMSLEELPQTLVHLYRRNRFHFQPAGDSLPLMRWCLDFHETESEKILTGHEYSKILSAEKTPVVERTGIFFAARKKFLEKDIQAWHGLNSVYQPLWNFMRDWGAEKLVILTNKNREATLAACHHRGLAVLSENVYSGDGGMTKIQNFSKIQQRFPEQEFSFIDDSLSNLRELHEALNHPTPQIELCLANWGYVGPEDIEHAARDGFRVCSQSDVITWLGC